MNRLFLPLILAASAVLVPSAPAINIVVDYSLDSNNFFDTQAKKDTLEAATDRYSSIITSSLAAVSPSGTGTGTSAGWRVGFTHPGDGSSYQISTAADFGSDPLSGSGAADQYGYAGLVADQWTLFAGGRALGSAGTGGTGTGTNFTTTFDDESGPMHRGVMDNTPSNSVNDLPRWGGSISFDTGTAWNFDLGSTGGGLDFYSIALHEVGHALGLSTSWNQWKTDGSGEYVGATAVTAYNNDNGTALTSLNEVSPTNPHWEDGTYEAFLYPGGETVGTVPGGTKQDLLMEPIANFGGLQQRFELTNVDVAALNDLNWLTPIPEPSRALLSLLAFAMVLARRRR